MDGLNRIVECLKSCESYHMSQISGELGERFTALETGVEVQTSRVVFPKFCHLGVKPHILKDFSYVWFGPPAQH